MSKSIHWGRVIGIVVSVLAVELILMVIFVYSGIYNVSTMSPDPGFLRWVFGTTSDNSAQHHSEGIAVPSLTDSTMIADGFHHYNEMCAGCHGAPGVKRSPVGRGLYPHPPDLARSAKELSPARLFWVVKNGIKSTGMPGFGWTHTNQQIWSIIAFLEQMKNMTPEQYAALRMAAVNQKSMESPGKKMGRQDHEKM